MSETSTARPARSRARKTTEPAATNGQAAPAARRQRQPRPPKLRALMPRDIVATRVDELVPGLITSDGVVVDTEPFSTRTGQSLGIRVSFTSGVSWVESAATEVDVLGRLTGVVAASVLAGESVRPTDDDDDTEDDDA